MWGMTFEKSLRMFSPKRPDDMSQTLLREVCNTWVNGRRVLDGIPFDLRRQVVASLGGETESVTIEEDIKIGCTLFRRGVSLATVLKRIQRGPAQQRQGDEA